MWVFVSQRNGFVISEMRAIMKREMRYYRSISIQRIHGRNKVFVVKMKFIAAARNLASAINHLARPVALTKMSVSSNGAPYMLCEGGSLFSAQLGNSARQKVIFGDFRRRAWNIKREGVCPAREIRALNVSSPSTRMLLVRSGFLALLFRGSTSAPN